MFWESVHELWSKFKADRHKNIANWAHLLGGFISKLWKSVVQVVRFHFPFTLCNEFSA